MTICYHVNHLNATFEKSCIFIPFKVFYHPSGHPRLSTLSQAVNYDDDDNDDASKSNNIYSILHFNQTIPKYGVELSYID